MKHFLKIFILIEVLLFSYIFVTSIYNIYEKNHVVSGSMQGYAIQENDPERFGKFYDEIAASAEGHKVRMFVNTVTETKKTEYDIYCLPFDSSDNKQPVTSSMRYNYKELTKDDFTDSTGLFYTDMPEDKINKLAADAGLTLKQIFEESISYSVFFKLFLIDFIVLLAVIEIVYCIYTSYSLKKIGIKKSMGFSNGKILKEQIESAVFWLTACSLATTAVMLVYLLIRNRMSLTFVGFILVYFAAVIVVNVLCILSTSFLVGLVSLEAMVKNKSMNRSMNITAQFIKVLFTILISVTVILVLDNAKDYRESNQKILDYKQLDSYYTSNGFYSTAYEKVARTPEMLESSAQGVKKMYSENDAMLCDASSLDLKHIEGIEDQLAEYELNKIIINKNYFEEFTDITSGGNKIALKDGVYTALVSEKYKNIDAQIKEFLDFEFRSLSTYDELYGLKTDNSETPEFEVIYTDTSSTIKCCTENGFESFEAQMVLIDNGNSGNTFYFDNLGGTHIFFRLGSREEFSALLARNDLDGLVSPGTLLTPFYSRMENVEFTLKTLSVFAGVFVVSLAFIIYISCYIDIIVNKSRYAIKETSGFSHGKILKKRYMLLAAELLLILVLSIFKQAILCSALAVLMDVMLYEVLYRAFISNKIYEIVKGA